VADQKTAVIVFRDLVEKQVAQFLKVMDQRTCDRFVRTLMTNYQEKVEVQKCDPMTILHVAMRAAQDGLMLDGVEAAIVPFKDAQGPGQRVVATYVPMIQGIRKKVRNSGLLSDWIVRPVYEGDEFEMSFGTNEYIHHKPSETGGRTRKLRGVYSIATFKDGTKSHRYMNRDEVEDIRSKSKAKHGPWDDPIFYPEMAVKTLARNHSKQLPMSSDMVVFWQRDDEDTGAISGPQSPPITNAPPKRIASVADALDDFGAGAPMKQIEAPAPGTDERPRAGGTASPDTSNEKARGPDTSLDRAGAGEDAPLLASGGGGGPGQTKGGSGGGHPEKSYPHLAGKGTVAVKVTDGGGGQTGTQGVSGDSPSAKAAETDALKRAYVRGQHDRKAGKTDEQMPDEYRTNDRNKEQIAWISGFDGKPMPTWGAQK